MGRINRGIGALTLLLTAAFLLSGSATAVHPTSSTYTVTFSEHGLPKGTSWSVYFGGSTYASSKSNLTVSGVSSGSYYFYAKNPVPTITAGVQYSLMGFSGGYMSVPGQLSQMFSYVKAYQVSFAESPSGGGNIMIGGNTMYGPQYFYTGRTVPVTALPAYGFTFSSWTTSGKGLAVASKSAASTVLTVGGTGTLTAGFKPVSYAISYSEVGLPLGTRWSVVSGGVTYSSSTSTVAVGKVGVGYLGVNVPVVPAGGWTQYAPLAYAGYLYVPSTTTETISFVKQYQVDLLTSGSGSTSPSGLAYYTAGTNVSITAYGTSSTVFSAWSASPSSSIGFGSKTESSTNMTVHGPANVTASFTTTLPCTSCKVSIVESGLPSGTTWSIAYNGSYYYDTVSSSSNSIALTGITGYISFQTPQYVNAGGTSGALYVAQSTYGSISAPNQLGYTYIFVKSFYLSFTTSGPGSVAPNSGWYPAGQTLSIWSATTAYSLFSKWTSTSKLDKIGKSKSEGTTLLVAGPATVTVDFKVPTAKVTFTEVGLPSGTAWSILFDGAVYGSKTTTITLPAVAWGGNGWSAGTPIAGAKPGVDWVAFDNNYNSLGGTVWAPFQTSQTILYTTEDLVNIYTSGTSGGSTNPSGAQWVPTGWVIPVTAINGSSATFSSWSSNATGVAIGQSGWPSTYVTVTGPGTLTAKFV
jgi:hypothetical protein